MGFLRSHIHFGAEVHPYYHAMSLGGGGGDEVAASVGARGTSSTLNVKK
jgi:hypothetical protein